MSILYAILTILICNIFAYLLGSASTSIIVGKVFFHKDIREYGSKNAGGTNAGRVLGKKAGIAVMIIDISKALIVFWSLFLLFSNIDFTQFTYSWVPTISIYSSLFLLSVGHCWPIFFNFKGGKTVSIFAGIILATNWLFTIVGLPVYILILKLEKKVSLSSIIVSSGLALASWAYLFPALNGFGFYPILIDNPLLVYWIYALLLTITAIELIARHRTNIDRLMKNTETKIKWMK
ncbi:MAG: glycerol-3-phosphate 1-O-acyltransferase PlsY [Bacilli bacterium]|jgi:glycerol-3-phosphate acyltransferase PlsY|nr:glycerol-3-phosphate 1-O-acyltransferase PlsY [Bacilli bacterium]MDD3388853.1 glycerol-3-phosphate 1-O-acyltransferase PlsY [Bacilli bacterium]MDD4344996.1 glycerol-3-phosphate 1-O-acyltransferase PlsY [Bacilli bacterium]MDD4520533.1 glycerol-3-phosphate 1-O-acyltransferase PlsY [Bacilli bacterium]MDY0399225.1 glycerol-3-phosphate 1-O-acyltransferase PlsY [Bacilli bacterium]